MVNAVTIFTCKSMRTAVMAAVVLLAIGFLLMAPALILPEPVPHAMVILIYPGFAALLMSPVIIFLAALASLFPSVNARLENCQH